MRFTEKEFKMNKIYVKEIFPLVFYRQCHACDCFVKKEKVWLGLYYDRDWEEMEILHLCNKCCETHDAVKQYIKKWKCL